MKILVVCQHFYPENFRINDLCFELKKRGNDVTVLTGLPNYPKGKIFKGYRFFKNRNQTVNGVKIKRCSLIGRGQSLIRMIINYMWFAIFASIKAFFMKKDFDVVYVYQISPVIMAWPAIVVSKLKKIPLVVHVLDQWPVSITTGGISKNSFAYKILTSWSKGVYNSADVITCGSSSFKNYLTKELGLPESKGFFYLPSYAESNYENIERTENGVFDLLFAGNIGPAQSVETVIEAANLLKDKKDIMFHIVGDGLSYQKCVNLAESYGLNNVKFYGYHPVEKMPEYYAVADAVLITMVDNEVVNSTLPAKIQSYMAAERTVIGAISGEAEKVIKEANCGLCCKSLDYKTLADLILKAKDSDNLTAWAKNGYNYYKEHFGKDKCVSDLENLLKTLV